MLIDSQAMVMLAKITNTNDKVSLYNPVLDSCMYILEVGEEKFESYNPLQAILAAYNSLFADNLITWESFTIRVCAKNEYMVIVDELDEIVTHEINRIAENMVANPSEDFIQKLSKLLYVEDNTMFRFEKKGKYITLREKKSKENSLETVVVNTKIKDILDDALDYFTLRDRIEVEVKKRENNYNKSTEMIAQLHYQLKQLSLLPENRKELK